MPFNLEKLLNHFYAISFMPVGLYEENFSAIRHQSNSFSSAFAMHYLDHVFKAESNLDVKISTNFVICGYIRVKNSDQMLIVGPVMEHPCQRSTAHLILSEIGESSARVNDVLNYFSKVPPINLSNFIRYLSFLNYLVNQEEPEERFIDELISSYEDLIPNEDKRDNFVMHNSEEAEKIMLDCVEQGNIGELTLILKNEIAIEGNMGITANDSIRAYKNMYVTTVALASRAAVKGGVNYETAMNTSDMYLQEMEYLNTYDEVHALWVKMLIDFATLANKCRYLNEDSALVHKVCNYVYDHLYEPFSVADIAEALKLNRSYMSRTFKQDASMTIIDFINQTKIHEAQRLLKISQHSMIEIAMMLGFSSQNYFQTVFKKYVGHTPATFRKSIHL